MWQPVLVWTVPWPLTWLNASCEFIAFTVYFMSQCREASLPWVSLIYTCNSYQYLFLLALFSCNFDDQLSPNFKRFVVLCTCWDTPNENTGLWQLSKVSSACNCGPERDKLPWIGQVGIWKAFVTVWYKIHWLERCLSRILKPKLICLEIAVLVHNIKENCAIFGTFVWIIIFYFKSIFLPTICIS